MSDHIRPEYEFDISPGQHLDQNALLQEIKNANYKV